MLVISRLVTCGHFSQVCVEKLPSVSVEKLPLESDCWDREPSICYSQQRHCRGLQRDKEQEEEGGGKITMSLEFLNPVVHMIIPTICECSLCCRYSPG